MANINPVRSEKEIVTANPHDYVTCEPNEDPDGLTVKEQLFIIYYCGEARFNGQKAAVLAGYDKKNAHNEVYRLKKTPSIRARINAYLNQLTAHPEEILTELTRVAMADHEQLVEVKTDLHGVVQARLNLSDKVKALEVLAKANRLLTERIENQSEIKISVVYEDKEYKQKTISATKQDVIEGEILEQDPLLPAATLSDIGGENDDHLDSAEDLPIE